MLFMNLSFEVDVIVELLPSVPALQSFLRMGACLSILIHLLIANQKHVVRLANSLNLAVPVLGNGLSVPERLPCDRLEIPLFM